MKNVKWKINILNRNLSFAFKGFSNQFNKGGDYHKNFKYAKKFIQININDYNFPKDKEIFST